MIKGVKDKSQLQEITMKAHAFFKEIKSSKIPMVAAINGAALGSSLSIDVDFTGISTIINNRTYQLGSNFVAGIASAVYNKKSGEIIYIDNRPPIPRSASQKEDIKIVLEF